MKIADMFPEERPREKARRLGVGSLSSAELIAILIRTGGTGGRSAVDVARDLLLKVGGRLTGLLSASSDRMQEVPDIGPDKALTLEAALEIARRIALDTAPPESRPVTGPEPIFRRMLPRLRGLDHEESWAVFLSSSKRIIGEERLTVGSMDQTLVDIPALVRRCLERKAKAVILVHNHPSGDPRPGQADLLLTRQLQHALQVLGLLLLDHIIVTDTRYFSFDNECEKTENSI